MLPFSILRTWFVGLAGIAILVGGIYCLWKWYDLRPTARTEAAIRAPLDEGPAVDEVAEARAREKVAEILARRERHSRRYLIAGILLLTFSLLGRPLSTPFLGSAGEGPVGTREGTVHYLDRPDGSRLRVETYGPIDAPPLVLTHGWSLDSTIWHYVKQQLAEGHRLIVWDLPGLGESTRPANNDHSLEKMARDLDAVLAFAGAKPVVLAGHSIGGMIILTYCRLFPEKLGTQVTGLALITTTYINPVKTARFSSILEVLQKPLIEPLLHLSIWLSPVVWLMNWQSYLNGSTQRGTRMSSFGGSQTRGQVDFAARFTLTAPPDVVSRGNLAMLGLDARDVLGRIPVPVLIVAGANDRLTVPEASEYMRAHIPHAQLVTLPKAGHLGLLERNPDLSQALRDFVKNCRGGGPKVQVDMKAMPVTSR